MCFFVRKWSKALSIASLLLLMSHAQAHSRDNVDDEVLGNSYTAACAGQFFAYGMVFRNINLDGPKECNRLTLQMSESLYNFSYAISSDGLSLSEAYIDVIDRIRDAVNKGCFDRKSAQEIATKAKTCADQVI